MEMDFLDLDLEYEPQDTDGSEEEEDEEVEIAPSSEVFLNLSAREGHTVALAFTIPDTVPVKDQSGVTLAWSREAIAAFGAIRKGARATDDDLKNFPYAYLRGAMEVCLPEVLRLERDMGLGRFAFERRGRGTSDAPHPFAYLEGTPSDDLKARLHVVLDDWLVNNLFPKYVDPGRVEERLRASVGRLADERQLITMTPFASRAMPWSWNPSTGSAREPDDSFRALADMVAKTLAGKELFQGLGPMRRLIASSGGMNTVELVSAPVPIGKKGRLSLAVRLRVETVPAMHQPLLVMDISKRRWLESIKEDTFDRGHISGTVFCRDYADRAFGFYVARRRKFEGEGWSTDNTFEAIRRTLGLPLTTHDAESIIRGEADTARSEALLVYRPGVSGDRHEIQAGVPDLDKLQGFHAARDILKEIGLEPFSQMTRVKAKHGKAHEDIARVANASALLGAMLERLASSESDGEQFTAEYLQNLSDADLNTLLQGHFGFGVQQVFMSSKVLLRELAGSRTSSEKQAKAQAKALLVLERLIEANRGALRRMYGSELPRLVLFHEDGPEAQVGLRLLRAALKLLWGDLEVVPSRLPAGTHGPKLALDPPDATRKPLSSAARSARRLDAWKGVTEGLGKLGKRHLCLVMARAFYRTADGAGKTKRDDSVNKPSTRRALAMAGCSVQFLVPPGWTQKGEVRISDFIMRAQAAMKDLISAHWGRIDTVQSAVQDLFPDPATQPREIIGITIVRRQGGRASRSIEASFLPVAIRLDVSTGRCTLRCAYEHAKMYRTSPWEHLPEALSRIAGLTPVKLSDDFNERKIRFMRFVLEIIGESVEGEAQPVVLIDSTNTARLWPWLADVRIDPGKIDIGEREFMHEDWAGARIVRVRQELTPSLITEKYAELARSSEEDSRPWKSLSPDLRLPIPSSPGQGLFRLGGQHRSGCVAYVSVGRKLLLKQKRGVSCYRSMTLPATLKRNGKNVKNSVGRSLVGLVNCDTYIGQWPTPNPLEIVVTLRQEGDDPDRLAEFVERLRYGFGHYREWTSLPAPLFFERVVREYITQFEIEAEDDEGDDAE